MRTAKKMKKLVLALETLRTLETADMARVVGGRPAETKWTYCGQGGPTECYKPNPY